MHAIVDAVDPEAGLLRLRVDWTTWRPAPDESERGIVIAPDAGTLVFAEVRSGAHDFELYPSRDLIRLQRA